MWDLIKDGASAFLGAFVIFLSLIFIPEIRRSKIYSISACILMALLFYLGIDKSKRDNRDKEKNEIRRIGDSANINSLGKRMNILIQDRTQDSLNFSDFSKKLESKYHIIDSANEPVQIKNYNTHINKADKVIIGGEN